MSTLEHDLFNKATKVHKTTHGHTVFMLPNKTSKVGQWAVVLLASDGTLHQLPLIQSEAQAVKAFHSLYMAIR